MPLFDPAAAGLTNFVESTGTFSAVTWVKLAQNNAAARVDMVLAPKSGAFYIGPQADGTATGGANRGLGAADLQSSRLDTSQVASGANSFACGSSCKASGSGSVAMGFYTVASNTQAFASGSSTTASGQYSTALGVGCLSSGSASISVGNTAHATGASSAAMGQSTIASGITSTATGDQTTSSGVSSFSMGFSSTAQAYASVAIGRFNLLAGSTGSWVATDPLLVAGNGASSGARSNALTLLKNGTMTIAGPLTATAVVVDQVTSAAATLSITSAVQRRIFTGTTSTWTMAFAPAGNTGYVCTIHNRGSGTITLNSTAGANDFSDLNVAVNTKAILAGETFAIYCDGTSLIIH